MSQTIYQSVKEMITNLKTKPTPQPVLKSSKFSAHEIAFFQKSIKFCAHEKLMISQYLNNSVIRKQVWVFIFFNISSQSSSHAAIWGKNDGSQTSRGRQYYKGSYRETSQVCTLLWNIMIIFPWITERKKTTVTKTDCYRHCLLV